MLFPSFVFTLILALHCVEAIIIFRNGNASVAVKQIRDGTQPPPKGKTVAPDSDFDRPDADGNTPANANKGLSVSTNVIPDRDAPGIAQLIANANAAPVGPQKTAALKLVKDGLSNLDFSINANAIWQADFSETTFPGFGLKNDKNPSDSGHKLLTVTTKTPKSTLQQNLNAKFTKLSQDQVFTLILALGGNPTANVAAPPAGSGTSGTPGTSGTSGTSGTPPANPIPPVAPGKAPVTPPTVPPTGQKPAPPTVPPSGQKPAPPTVPPSVPPTIPKQPTLPKPPTVPVPRPPTVPVSKPPTVPIAKPPTVPIAKPPTVPKAPTVPKPGPIKPVVNRPGPAVRRSEESLRMRRVRRTIL